jgi:hypothetical protein
LPSLVLRYNPPVHNEQSLIAAFVKRSKRDRYRYREMLAAG